MRVCVLHRYPLSLVKGTNPSFELFLKKLVAAGHDVTFVSLRETEHEAGIPGVRIIELPFEMARGKASGKLISSLRWTWRVPFLVRALNGAKPLDLVYCDDSFPGYGWLVKKIARTRTIIRLGDLHSAYQFASGGPFARLLFRLSFGLEKAMWRGMDGLVPISEAFRQFLIREGLPESKIAWVQECIDLDFFKPRSSDGSIRRRYGIPAGAPLVMFHGLVAGMKGLLTFLDAVPKVRAAVPEARFMIVGDGPALTGLRRKADAMQLGNAVHFTGWVPFGDIPKYLAEATMGVPCRSGNVGNNFVVTTALLQYWAMEKPIVVPDLEAIHGCVITGHNGLLFKPDDSASLADGIVQLLRSPECAAEMGRVGRRTAHERFNVDVVSDNMLRALRLV